MDRVLSRHDELVHGAVRRCGGEVYKHTGDGIPEIYVMSADGSGQTNFTNNPATDWLPS